MLRTEPLTRKPCSTGKVLVGAVPRLHLMGAPVALGGLGVISEQGGETRLIIAQRPDLASLVTSRCEPRFTYIQLAPGPQIITVWLCDQFWRNRSENL